MIDEFEVMRTMHVFDNRSHPPAPSPWEGGSRASLWAGLMVVSVYAVVIVLVVTTGVLRGSRAAFDQELYHRLVVERFAEQWPAVDLRDYRSATTPGYHLLLAALAKVAGADVGALRLGGALFAVGLLSALAASIARRAGPIATAGFTALLGSSLYVFSSAAWMLPDNAAWWLVLVLIVLALDRKPTTSAMVLGGLVLAALVLMRQIQIWAAGVVWLSAWLGAGGEVWSGEPIRSRVKRLAVAVAATLPAFLVLAWFAELWHGLVPPMFQRGGFDPLRGKAAMTTTGGNPATPAFVLTLIGIYGVALGPWFGRGWRAVWGGDRASRAAVVIGAAVGFVLALVPTSWSFELHRYTGYWIFAKHLPVIAERSVFILGGSVVGGAVLGVVWASLVRRDGWILLGTVIAFTAAQTTTAFAWQRYLEPLVLIVLILAAVRAQSGRGWEVPVRGERVWAAWRAGGPWVLAAVLAAISVIELRPESPQLTEFRERLKTISPGSF